MPDIIITPSIGKLEFIDNSAQVTRRHSFTLDHSDGLVLDAPLSAAAVIAPLNVINVTVNNSNVNYPFVLAQSGETGAKNLLMDGTGGTYNPFTNTATIDISGNSATTTLASNSTNLGGVAAASYVTLTGTQTLTNKTITGTFTGNLTGTGSWATNAVSAVSATTSTNSTQLNGQAASYYTNIPARLGYTPVNQAGDTIAGNLTVNGNFTVNGSVTAFSASNIYLSSSVITVEDNILTLNAFSPYLRYAGIEMYDSGSGTLSQLLWDGDGDYFFLTGSSVNGKIITGPDGQTNLTSNYIPKATAGYKLGNSLIYDDGTNVGIGTTSPATKFHVFGNAEVGDSTADTGLIVRHGAGAAQYGRIRFYSTSTNIHTIHSFPTAWNGGTFLNASAGAMNLQGTNGITFGSWNNIDVAFAQGGNNYFKSNVGIGSTSPAALLNVRASAPTGIGSTPTGTNLLIDSNTSNYITFRNTSDNGTYAGLIFLDNNVGGYIAFGNAGASVGSDSMIYGAYQDHIFQNGYVNENLYNRTETMRIKQNGYVGIGTSNPIYKFQVVGSAYVNAGTLLIDSGNSISWGNSTQYIFGSNGIGLSFAAGSATRMFVSSSGNIGMGTTNPTATLQVGTNSISATNNNSVNVRIGQSNAAGAIYGLSLANTATATVSNESALSFIVAGNYSATGMISTILRNTTTAASDLVFTNYNNALFERMRIQFDGNVGIGTTSPAYKLDVNGTFNATGTSTLAGVSITGTINSSATEAVRVNNNSGYISIYNSAGTTRTGYIQGLTGGSLTLSAENGALLQFLVGGTERLRIDTSGNVGIGSTAPNDKLDVVGRVYAYRYIAVSSNASLPAYATDTNTGMFNAATNQIGFSISSAEKVRIDTNGNVGVGTTAPGQKLDVEGRIRTRGATGTGGFEIGAATTGAAKWRIEWDSASDSLDFNWVG